MRWTIARFWASTPAELEVYARGAARERYRADCRAALVVQAVIAYSGRLKPGASAPKVHEILGFRESPEF